MNNNVQVLEAGMLPSQCRALHCGFSINFTTAVLTVSHTVINKKSHKESHTHAETISYRLSSEGMIARKVS